MTRLLSVLALVAVVAVVGIVAGGGCGARMQVFGDKIISKVDKALGALDVKLKKVKNERDAIAADLKKVENSLYTSRAKFDLLTDKKKNAQNKIEGIKANVAQLSDFLSQAAAAEDKSIEINRKTYTLQVLEGKAKDIKNQFDRANIELDGYEQRLEIYTASVGFLSDQQEKAEALLSDLNNKISIIEERRSTIVSVQQDALMNTDDKSLTERLAKLADDVENLDIETDVEFQIAQDDLEKISKDNGQADDIFTESEGVENTQRMLQDILGSE